MPRRTGTWPGWAAERAFRKRYELVELAGPSDDLASACADLARVTLRRGAFAEVRRWADIGYAAAEPLGDPAAIRLPLHMRAATVRMEGRHDEARRLYVRSIELNEELGNAVNIAGVARIGSSGRRLDSRSRRLRRAGGRGGSSAATARRAVRVGLGRGAGPERRGGAATRRRIELRFRRDRCPRARALRRLRGCRPVSRQPDRLGARLGGRLVDRRQPPLGAVARPAVRRRSDAARSATRGVTSHGAER